MKKELLLRYCRYYDGAKENTFEVKERNRRKNEPHVDKNCMMLWFYEMAWCEELRKAKSIDDLSTTLQEDYIVEYKHAGLETFHQGDGAPLSLKALLFNRYMKGSMDGNVEPFKRFYNNYYGLIEYHWQTRSEIIEKCNHYKGEESTPAGSNGLMWNYEKNWVDTVEREIINNEKSEQLWSWLYQYRSAGLEYFHLTPYQLKNMCQDNVPESLKAMLYSQFVLSFGSDTNEFKKWYKREYYSFLNSNRKR